MRDGARSAADPAFWRLTRQFFAGLFRLGFLNDQGADAFTRVVIGIASVVFALGLAMARIYMGKYAYLSGLGGETYRQAAVADEAFVLAMSMWLVAFVTVIASRSLFPDQTDFRVLTPLPVNRSVIFGAK